MNRKQAGGVCNLKENNLTIVVLFLFIGTESNLLIYTTRTVTHCYYCAKFKALFVL